MNIRRNCRFTILLTLLAASLVCAAEQTADDLTGISVGDARLLLQAGREQSIREEMRFSDAEAAAFWPAYDAYQGDLMVVRNRYASLLEQYLVAYRAGNVSDEFAEQLIDGYLKIQGDILKIRKKHLKAFRKILPARKAARFYQLENKMDAELAGELAIYIPMIDAV